MHLKIKITLFSCTICTNENNATQEQTAQIGNLFITEIQEQTRIKEANNDKNDCTAAFNCGCIIF